MGFEDAASRLIHELLPVDIIHQKKLSVESSASLVRAWPLTAVLAVVVFTLAGCDRTGATGSPHQASLVGAASGTIHLDLLADGDPVIYWQYAVAPHDGQVQLISEASFDRDKQRIPTEFDQPTGAIGACWNNPMSVSPNHKYVARCQDETEKSGQFSVVHHDAFIVEDRATGSDTFHWRMEEQRRIRGFSWSPDSSAVSILSLRLDYVRLAFLGHMAIPHDSIYLDVIGVDHQFAEFLVRRDVVHAWTRILKWTVP
jgi:hypothetical protein